MTFDGDSIALAKVDGDASQVVHQFVAICDFELFKPHDRDAAEKRRDEVLAEIAAEKADDDEADAA